MTANYSPRGPQARGIVPSKLEGKCSRLLATAREHLEQVHCIGIVREPVIEDARIDRESFVHRRLKCVSLASLSKREREFAQRTHVSERARSAALDCSRLSRSPFFCRSTVRVEILGGT